MSSPSGLRILIVDDDCHLREVAAMILRSLDSVEIHQASNAPEGWDLLCRHAFDVVLVDWMMRPVNGLQFVRRLRRSPDSPNPAQKVMFMTAHASAEFVQAAKKLGVSAIAVKPITAHALLTQLDKLCMEADTAPTRQVAQIP